LLAFASKLTIKAFDVGVLDGLARIDEELLDTFGISPFENV